MKKVFTTLTVLCFLLVFSFFYSCSKESVSNKNVLNTSASNNISVSSDTTTLITQPGPDDGDDAYVFAEQDFHQAAEGNDNAIPELMIAAWTAQGRPLVGRSYVKFNALNNIPATAHIVSAELSLYGLDPNTSISTPQGCSIYPGSPYNKYKENACVILRVIDNDWSEATITWLNKPPYTRDEPGFIPKSTSQWNYNITSDVTNMVQQMVTEQKNYGFCIRLRDEEIYRCMVFASSESTDAGKRPMLIVKYTL